MKVISIKEQYIIRLDLGCTDSDMNTDLLEDYAILQASLITCTAHCTLIEISLPEKEYGTRD